MLHRRSGAHMTLLQECTMHLGFFADDSKLHRTEKPGNWYLSFHELNGSCRIDLLKLTVHVHLHLQLLTFCGGPRTSRQNKVR